MAKAGKRWPAFPFTGQFADTMVFRDSNGQPIMSQKTHRKFIMTPAIKKQQWRFRHAARLAKLAIRDPEKRARLEAERKPGQTAYNVALSEYLLINC
jgi:hypothetical protein